MNYLPKTTVFAVSAFTLIAGVAAASTSATPAALLPQHHAIITDGPLVVDSPEVAEPETLELDDSQWSLAMHVSDALEANADDDRAASVAHNASKASSSSAKRAGQRSIKSPAKKWICGPMRELWQGSGSARECEWR